MGSEGELTDEERIRHAEAELWALRKSVKKKRKDASKTDGKLATAFREAMRLWDTLKANGGTIADLTAGLEQVLRVAWPKTREWHYTCTNCSDSGLVMHVCEAGARCNGISTRIDSPGATPGKYRRLCAQDPHSSYEHEYGLPCFCDRGRRFHDKPARGGDDFTAAGKSKPTRLGR